MTISYTIKPESIEWEMDWSGTNPDGSRKHPGMPEKEMQFEQEGALALLLNNGVVFVNSHHWYKEWPEAARKATSINVNCNDIFAWGCADAEEITMDDDELKDLYHMVIAEPVWGAALWCMKKRREMPQDPVAEHMRKAGVDLDAFQKEHNLRVNFSCGLGVLVKGVKYDDPKFKEIREEFKKNNGWEEAD